MMGRAGVLLDLGECLDAIATYECVIERFAEATDLTMRGKVAWARMNTGFARQEIGQNQAALAAYEDVISIVDREFESQKDGPILRALLNKAALLDRLDRTQDAIAAYDELEARFGAGNNPELRRFIDSALARRSYLLEQSANKRSDRRFRFSKGRREA